MSFFNSSIDLEFLRSGQFSLKVRPRNSTLEFFILIFFRAASCNSFSNIHSKVYSFISLLNTVSFGVNDNSFAL